MSSQEQTCPTCHTALAKTEHRSVSAWTCDRCGGSAVTLDVLASHVREGTVEAMMAKVANASVESTRACPRCGEPLRTFSTRRSNANVELDACKPCGLLWFDASELEQLGVKLGRELPYAAHRAAVKPHPYRMPGSTSDLLGPLLQAILEFFFL